MAKKKAIAPVNKGGRPQIEIDPVQFEALCGLHATLPEFASVLKCSEDTIERWCLRHYGSGFAEVNRQKRGTGSVSLRRRQYELAMSGNPTMLIWLGKQMLGQADKHETKVDQTTTNIGPTQDQVDIWTKMQSETKARK